MIKILAMKANIALNVKCFEPFMNVHHVQSSENEFAFRCATVYARCLLLISPFLLFNKLKWIMGFKRI